MQRFSRLGSSTHKFEAMCRLAFSSGMVIAFVYAHCVHSLFAAELTLSDFNGTGFDYVFGGSGFTQTVGPTSVRIFDPVDDSGGVGTSLLDFEPPTNQPLNLSSHADSRFVIDMFTNPGNGINRFDLELIDTSSGDRSGKWTFNVGHLPVGVPSTLVSTTTLANPTHGLGDFANLDLNNIETWQILGSYTNSSPFDMSFDRVAISDTVAPPPAYPGQEPDAPWRSQAASRIAANRMANLQVNVTDSLGNALTGANVSVAMKQHEFGFGSAVVGNRLDGPPTSNAMYKQKVEELFNIATLENTLKWQALEGEYGSNFSQQIAQDAITWLDGKQIDVRGHNLIWPGTSFLPDDVANLVGNAPLNASQQQQLRNRVAAHIADIAGDFEGQLTAWDVINEERANHDVMDVLSEGELAMVDWFTQAKAADSVATLYLNEFGILDSSGGTNTANQQTYFDVIQYLKDQGAPIEGIGFQGHFRPESLTGPVGLWDILDRFEQHGLDMQITEFDFETTDEQLQADFTRDFLTAMFAHEGVDDVLMWGFWENAHWRPNAAMFNSDWSIKPNGQAYLDLVFGEWWTDEDLATLAGGVASLDGFKGEYEITVTLNGEEQSVLATLTDGGLSLDVALPTLSADFDGDGNVDGDDLTIWKTNFGQATTQPFGDANGDGVTDGGDFFLWQQQLGMSVSGSLTSVPEPASWCLLLMALTGYYHLRKTGSFRLE